MSTPTLDEEVKARIPQGDKDKLQRMADFRHLKISDILREAIREKLTRESRRKASAA